MKIKIISILVIFLLANCSQRLADVTIISTKNIDLSNGSEFKRGTKRVIGKDVNNTVFFFTTRVLSIKEAIDRAIEVTPGTVALMRLLVIIVGIFL